MLNVRKTWLLEVVDISVWSRWTHVGHVRQFLQYRKDGHHEYSEQNTP